MGLLSRYALQGWGAMQPAPPQPEQPVQFRAPAPFQPAQAPTMNALPGMPTLQPMAEAQANTATVRPAGFMERLETTLGSPTLQAGLALMGRARGSDWSGFSQDLQGINRTEQERRLLAEQRRRQQTQDRRDETAFGRQQTEWGQQDQQRRDWEAAVQQEADPTRRATLRAMGPGAYGEWMAGEQQRRFAAEQSQLDRDANITAAHVRASSENGFGRYFQAMDAQTLGDLNQQAAQLQAVGLPQLRNLRNTITQGAALTGQPIDYNSRITLGRYFNGSSPERQTLEVWNAQVLGPALETLRGLGAMSEREMEAAVNSMSNPNMTVGAAMQLVDERIATAERRVAASQAAGTFFSEAGGLTGTRNSAGQDWPTYLQATLGETPGAGTTENNLVPRSGYGPPSAAAVAELRRDTSAAARREFDQTFGPGAAERALRPRRRNPTIREQMGGGIR